MIRDGIPASAGGTVRALRGLGPWAAAIAAFAVLLLAFLPTDAQAERLHERFSAHDPASRARIDHSAWDGLLKAYLSKGEDGLNRFDYAGLKKSGLGALREYLRMLQAVDPSKLSRAEQFAFWANLYNAKTVEIVASRYPVASIRDIRLTNFLVPGPWRKNVLKVSGVDLSLDSIEHGIMRPIWRDPRIHYAVNCASVGCPNLPARAWTGKTLETRLNDAARAYINSPRGVRFDGGRVTVSSLYDWYAGDFGDSTSRILGHIRKYAAPELASKLAAVTRFDGHEYDWALNDAK